MAYWCQPEIWENDKRDDKQDECDNVAIEINVTQCHRQLYDVVIVGCGHLELYSFIYSLQKNQLINLLINQSIKSNQIKNVLLVLHQP